ncbi:DUF4864 domain-containing protein [Maribius pontilimi]|uniref:DUF4864 domain-containing protein n=1 Tax=Palleronia pontilimi TaxID=1964209 RepID=A0A934IHT9_9RHOB|nr:DUF4864 domain-containing protein [Palleronia pontilimi]MBJ3762149.1 DUF4864 domain-containing protein [Palleronia pontilimi]
MKFLATTLLALTLCTAAQAQETDAQQVIADQITAFQADDFETAFSYASPMIKGMFGTPERFGMMVEQGYPMVYRPAEVRYLNAREVGPVTRQRVMMRDADGALHVLEYEMIQVDGAWQINGVQLLRAPQVGA